MRRHSMRFALLAGVCAAGLALSGCDDEPDRAEKTQKSGDQLATDREKSTTTPKPAEPAETDRNRAETAPTQPGTRQAERDTAPGGKARTIRAALKGKDGQDMGSVEILEQDGKVVVRYQGSGLPEGQHAIHFHAKGACDGPDFKSAGDHWRPANWKAEGTNAEVDPGHLGDITVKDGKAAEANFVNAYASLAKEAPNSLFDEDGVSIVVHAKADPNGAKPGGDAGDGIACAVLEPKPGAATPNNKPGAATPNNKPGAATPNNKPATPNNN